MTVAIQPNWSLVTDYYQEPKNFAELLALLTPKRSGGYEKRRALLTLKEKEFYKQENLKPFIVYAVNKVAELPKFHRDEMSVILRIIRLCQEAEMYIEGYYFMKQQQLIQFVHTSLAYTEWDAFTKAVAWNYLILKNKASRLDEADHAIWDRVKFDEECIQQYAALLSHKEMLHFTFAYICKKAHTMSVDCLEEMVMDLSEYCNKYIVDLYEYGLCEMYQRCTEVLADYNLRPSIIACQRSVMAQLTSLFNLSFSFVDDFLFEIKEVIEHMDFNLLYTYETFIGKLLSYIPFFEMVSVPRHAYYIEDILYMCKGTGYLEDLIRNYVVSQLPTHFLSFIKPFLRNKQYAAIHEILFYWCTDEQRAALEEQYNLDIIYEKYASG